MQRISKMTAREKLEVLKRGVPRITDHERIEAGEQRFERMGIEADEVEKMARLVGLEAIDLYFVASGTSTLVKTTPQVPAETSTGGSIQGLHDRLQRVEQFIARFEKGGANTLGSQWNSEFVGHLRRIADHFDPPNLQVVGTSYVADRLGVTQKWVGELVRKMEIPRSCICPKSGGGNYWRFWKTQIDKWIDER